MCMESLSEKHNINTQDQEPTETRCKQPIRTRYLGHVNGYQPIRDSRENCGQSIGLADQGPTFPDSVGSYSGQRNKISATNSQQKQTNISLSLYRALPIPQYMTFRSKYRGTIGAHKPHPYIVIPDNLHLHYDPF
eukprot:sb/3474695/